jgi:hypothetical protein
MVGQPLEMTYLVGLPPASRLAHLKLPSQLKHKSWLFSEATGAPREKARISTRPSPSMSPAAMLARPSRR